MSKELPFFKFTATEWLTGDISYESFDIQGLYIAICATYWAKNASITLAKLKQRLSNAKAEQWDCLIKGKYIEVINGRVVIKFLDEQIDELSSIRDKKVAAGRKGGLSKSHKSISSGALAVLKHKEEDKDKEQDKDKEREVFTPSRSDVLLFFKSANDKLDPKHNDNSLKNCAAKFYSYYGSQDWKKSNGQKIQNFSLAVENWLANEKTNKKSETSDVEVAYVPPREVAAAMEKLAKQKTKKL